ncbi:2-deoxy-D-gluconate 3-dehydrogenase [Sphingobium sp. SCG-1]|uniref:SDR family NAD(P)-dependent oxidoreductase n=1 Tax=Sphingobium sp. SCG-1 TaxID=2072936 RepID=UPI000CD6C614|nr:SDR family NAD(P)-dependent oxidoreductase [Sphingobium sp. SCG-1]AUW57142.1 2-deoxy-D-gluconate 3-dehydrogenase [Sphingobium sp. SCG-1]
MKNSELLAGKRALVTGASSGIGHYFARLLADHGAQVIAGARRVAMLDTLAAEIKAAGGQCKIVLLDVADKASVTAAVEQIGVCDILVNNAGIVRDGSALLQTEEDWDAVLDTNLKGMFIMSQAIAKGMKERGQGTIINIASVLGLRQAGGVSSYAVSKAGAIQLTKTLALEWARFGIRVNALAPGYLATEINANLWKSDPGKALINRIPQRRLGQLEDLAGPMLLLASEQSAYMTGSVITVDGGHLVSSL